MQPYPPHQTDDHSSGGHCFLAFPPLPRFRRIREAAKKAVRLAGFQPVSLDEDSLTLFQLADRLGKELSRVDCIIADLTTRNPNVIYEIGVARAMGKGVFLLAQQEEEIPSDLQGLEFFNYDRTLASLAKLTRHLTDSLERFRSFLRLAPSAGGNRSPAPFLVDWDRLERSEAENLCRELLVQMGYRRVDWSKRYREFDMVAELPKRDPDGFEYNEIWLISMGRNAPIEMFMDMVTEEGGFFLRHILRDEERLGDLARGADLNVTLLLILLDANIDREITSRLRAKQKELRSRRWPTSSRIRIWDRDYLTSLVQQFPQLGYKYFSDEGRSQSKYRKTPEELYQENVDLAERQAKLIADLTEEKNKRVRAERDAVWKDISFSAAHKIGNPIFAIETNLEPLQKRVSESRIEEALEVITRIRTSVEKAKGIVDQFKSLTRAQEIKPVSMLLRPVLEDACRTAREKGVACEIDCPDELRVQADPERLSECFDELVTNSLHWFDKPEEKIHVRVDQPALPPLPGILDSNIEYTSIQFSDNGRGVDLENKARIFDAFFTTQEHGTGLGLALVRRIIEGHGGVIFEEGLSGRGAEFEIYLPTGGKNGVKISRRPPVKRRRKTKE